MQRTMSQDQLLCQKEILLLKEELRLFKEKEVEDMARLEEQRARNEQSLRDEEPESPSSYRTRSHSLEEDKLPAKKKHIERQTLVDWLCSELEQCWTGEKELKSLI